MFRTIRIAARLTGSGPFLLLAWVSLAQASFSISGHLPGLNPGMDLVLLRENLDTRKSTEAGKLTVRGDHAFQAVFEEEPGLFSLVIPDYGSLALAIDDGQHLEIKTEANDLTDITVSGSPDTKVLHAYEAFRKESLERLVYPPRARLNTAQDAGLTAERLAPLAQAEVDGYNAHRRELNDFTIDRVGDSIALYATSLRWDGDYRLAELQGLVDAFAEKHPDLAVTRSMRERLRLFSLTATGAKGAPLAGRDLDGEEHALEDFRRRIVLVDFWASWCVPCRVENRHYPELLQKFADHGFSVFGVNLDDSRSAWARASQQDGVSWPQISDGMGLNSPMAQAYNVTALPMSFLLDGEGCILARNLRGEALKERLEAMFGP